MIIHPVIHIWYRVSANLLTRGWREEKGIPINHENAPQTFPVSSSYSNGHFPNIGFCPTTLYMLSFNFNKKKELGVREIVLGDKVLVEAVV